MFIKASQLGVALITLALSSQSFGHIDADQAQNLVISLSTKVSDSGLSGIRCSKRHRACTLYFSTQESCLVTELASTFDVMIDDDGLAPSPQLIEGLRSCVSQKNN